MTAAAAAVTMTVTYPETNDLALKAVHDHHHLSGLRWRVREILTDVHTDAQNNSKHASKLK